MYRMCTMCRNVISWSGCTRVKPVEGWKRGKAFVFYPERCISDGACIELSNNPSSGWDQWITLLVNVHFTKRCIHQGLGRRRSLIGTFSKTFFLILFSFNYMTVILHMQSTRILVQKALFNFINCGMISIIFPAIYHLIWKFSHRI